MLHIIPGNLMKFVRPLLLSLHSRLRRYGYRSVGEAIAYRTPLTILEGVNGFVGM